MIEDLHSSFDRPERHAIEGDINEVLVNLQFEDRIHQILDHVITDIERMYATASEVVRSGNEASIPDPGQWRAQLSHHYTMQEQHALHQEPQTDGKPVVSDSAILFF